MRHKLADHLNEYVLCKGWIGGWEDMKECSTRRVFIKQPTIKKADRNTLFAEQDVISTEHHLNLFIKFEDLSQYDTIWELNQTIQFAGVVEQYTRSNGTTDYGVYGTEQSTIHFQLERFIQSIKETSNNPNPEDIDLPFLEQQAKQLVALAVEVDEAGDRLPTFNKTYEDYKSTLCALAVVVPNIVRKTRAFLASRDYRRSKKVRKSAIEEARAIKTPRKTKKKETEELLARLRKA